LDIFFNEYWVLGIAAFLVGLSKGGLPGVGMISVPILVLRHQFDKKNLTILIPAGVLGVGIGWLTASYLSDTVVTLLIGLLGVSFCLNVWLRKQANFEAKQPSTLKGLFWGTLSGFTSFVAHAGAPPYQIYTLPQKMPRLVFAGTTTLLFACVNLAKVVPYAMIEPFTVAMVKSSLQFLPLALVGTVVGKFGVQALSDRWFYRLVQIALFLICLQLISQSVRTLYLS